MRYVAGNNSPGFYMSRRRVHAANILDCSIDCNTVLAKNICSYKPHICQCILKPNENVLYQRNIVVCDHKNPVRRLQLQTRCFGNSSWGNIGDVEIEKSVWNVHKGIPACDCRVHYSHATGVNFHRLPFHRTCRCVGCNVTSSHNNEDEIEVNK